MPRPALRWTAALLGLASLLVGCGDGRTTAEKKAAEGYLIINNMAEPSGLDPQTVTGLSESHIVGALFEGLVNYDPKDLHPIPGIAESWTMSADGRTWTFRLRQAAKWSNGDPITAADFLFSYERMLRPSFGAEYASMLHGIRGAKDFAAGRTKDFRTVGVRATDAHTLVIELEHPIPYFLQLLCHHSWIPVHPPTILRFGAIDALNTPWTRPGAMVSSGAFTLESWEVARRVVVRKNPLYWNAKEVVLDAVEFRAIADLFAEERAFRGGELHVTGAVPPYKVAKLRADKAPQLRIDPFLATAFVWVNCDIIGAKPADKAARKALSDPRVRRALGMALDRNLIAEKVLRAGEKPALHFTPPGTGGFQPTARWKQDAAEARRLLAEAGYPGGKGLPKFDYLYATSEGQQMVAQAYQEMWRRELGVEVELRNLEWKVYLTAMRKGEFHLCRGAWVGDYNDPNTFLEMLITGNELNNCNWSDAEYDRLLGLAARESDAAKRFGYFQLAEARLVEQAPVLPVVFNTNKYLMRPEVQGWHPTLLDQHPLSAVRLVPTRAKGD
ncbi:MAG: peptide ABC transporter substrate-binding protein [Opitutales bacterium]|jgi:oligopeptide transport system substrate-binding protein|nr:peptide ABC transporter substrate-binding protein [Opitutales bacterium]MDP4658777.1 peptide ABC transporter substrate-binding protein [Opitutales bacterium]MDP4774589.1 peptide ABC transporter substrate-binding protein [Opitutales bacterium]MDP4787662.1 peptide ABC transporter substrate-binding protein [Opitutales bacterium]MDP4860857.1 peptide ABC transporter substrate-binding protein [Opitutales bacterium]